MQVEELSIEHFSGKYHGYFEHDSNKIADDIHFIFKDNKNDDKIHIKGHGQNEYGTFKVSGEGQ